MHEQHKGHDAMHAEMIIILLVTLILAQVALVEWKKRHYRSFSVSEHNIFCFSKILKYQNDPFISDCHIVRFMDNSSMCVYQKYVVAFYILLADILLYYDDGRTKSIDETHFGHNS